MIKNECIVNGRTCYMTDDAVKEYKATHGSASITVIGQVERKKKDSARAEKSAPTTPVVEEKKQGRPKKNKDEISDTTENTTELETEQN